MTVNTVFVYRSILTVILQAVAAVGGFSEVAGF
jgi:hypothetical protein